MDERRSGGGLGLEEFIQQRFDRIFTNSLDKLMNYTWGDDLFFGLDNVGFIPEKESYILCTQEELLEHIELSFLEPTLAAD